MREYVQSNTSPGNCWQTCVACILDIEPDFLPSQVDVEEGRLGENKSYWNALQAYLYTHHNLAYTELRDSVWEILQVKDPGYHMLLGATERTPKTGIYHVVVARYGTQIWDPHPSRAGLTEIRGWGLLIPYPNQWRKSREDGLARDDKSYYCFCPACVAKR